MKTLLALLLLLLASTLGAATVQPPADHRTDWSLAGSLDGNSSGYPGTNGWTTYTVLTWPTHNRNDINTALAAAPAKGIVRLKGTGWQIDGGDIRFTRSSVQLVGEGAWLTRLSFTNSNGQAGISFNPNAWEAPPQFQRSWSSGYNKGDSNLTFSAVTSLSVGELLFLTQTSDGREVQGIGTEGACDYCAGFLYEDVNATNWTQQEQKLVTGISGNVVTVHPPLLATNWNVVKTPIALYFNAATLSNCWIADLAWTNTDSSLKYNVESMNMVNYGMYRCLSERGKLAHFKTLHTAFWSVQRCLFRHTVDYSTESYGIAPYNTSMGLVEDSGFVNVTGPWKGTSASGCVFAYNFNTNQIYANPSGSSTATNWLVGSYSTHGPFCHYNLCEGNMLNASYNDFIHGTSGWNTFLRNRIWGWQFDRTVNTFGFSVEARNLYYHLYGNVIGRDGFTVTPESYYNASVPSPDRSAILVGYRDTGHSTSTGDANTVSTFGRSHNLVVGVSTNNRIILGGTYVNADTVPDSLVGKPTTPAYFTQLNFPFPPFGHDQQARSTNIVDFLLPSYYRHNLVIANNGDVSFFFLDPDVAINGVVTRTGVGRSGSKSTKGSSSFGQ